MTEKMAGWICTVENSESQISINSSDSKKSHTVFGLSVEDKSLKFLPALSRLDAEENDSVSKMFCIHMFAPAKTLYRSSIFSAQIRSIHDNSVHGNAQSLQIEPLHMQLCVRASRWVCLLCDLRGMVPTSMTPRGCVIADGRAAATEVDISTGVALAWIWPGSRWHRIQHGQGPCPREIYEHCKHQMVRGGPVS